jgi:hypothetical protein
MNERTVLEWEDYPQLGGFTCSKSFSGKKWDIYVSGTLDNPTYNLTVGNILIIKQGIPTLAIAKQMAQQIQDVLDDCWGILGIT